MPKYYEPEHFEDCYSSFLEGNLSNGYYSYIDPDCVEDVGKTDFYKDLTDFLNEREKDCIDEKDRYLYLPPLDVHEIAKWMENHEELKRFKNEMDAKKIAVLKDGRQQFCLTSDQFGFSAFEGIYGKENYERYPLAKLLYSCRGKCEEKRKEVIGRITEYVKNTRTLGGSFLWPVHQEGNNARACMYNLRRGVGNYLEDRVDLTLREVKHALDCAVELKCGYNNYEEYEKFDILYDYYDYHKKDEMHLKKWLEHFGTFTNFIEYFMLKPFCKKMQTAEGSYEYIPINIIDGREIGQEKGEIRNIVKVRNLREEEILNMLNLLEKKILERTQNMEKTVKSYRENRKDKC